LLFRRRDHLRHRGDQGLTLNREGASFARARRAELTYGLQLRKIAKQIGDLTRGSGLTNQLGGIDPTRLPELMRTLDLYAQAITPWARSAAQRMLLEVGRRDDAAWRELAKRMGQSVHQEIRRAPTGVLFKVLMDQEVDLIRSLPREAALRVHRLTTEALSNSSRAREIAKEIERSGHVATARAMLIARTEVGRAAGSFTQARAEHIGSEGYIWRTAGDADVRPEHRRLEGTFHAWTDPPIAGPNGMRYHAGRGPNCRCYSEPVLPKIIAAAAQTNQAPRYSFAF
jgi:SPP1 gp7 family putative phage head morphogenesis protein